MTIGRRSVPPAPDDPPLDVPTERNPAPSSIIPIIVTHDLERLARFYAGVAGATETSRTPDGGPTFHLALRVGDSELGIVSNGSTATRST